MIIHLNTKQPKEETKTNKLVLKVKPLNKSGTQQQLCHPVPNFLQNIALNGSSGT